MLKLSRYQSAGEFRPPVIILGAARSGTKLLRELIAATGCYAEVPFDVNYIWRYGNESCPHDALPADLARERTRQFIRNWLRSCTVHPKNDIGVRSTAFVEKTVSNVLRIPFVKAVYPEARFVALVRDGRDVVESAERCWRAPPPTGYVLKKLRTFPWLHCAPYGWKYAATVVRRRLHLDKHLRTWGPRYPGIDIDLKRLSLLEVCARQWAASIELYEQSRHLFSNHQLLEMRYEDLVCSPHLQMHRLCDFLQIEARGRVLEIARRNIRSDCIGSFMRLPRKDLQRVLDTIRPMLQRWDYVNNSHARVA